MIDFFFFIIFSGSNDPDDLIVRAFKAYELEGENAGKIDAQMFVHALTTWGDKFTQAEVRHCHVTNIEMF